MAGLQKSQGRLHSRGFSAEVRDRDKLMIQLSRAKILEKYSERNLLYTPKESKQTLDLNKQGSAKETKYRVEEPEATWKTA